MSTPVSASKISALQENQGRIDPQVTLNQQEKQIEVLPAIGKEEGFSAKKHLLVGLVTAALAGAILPVCLPASIALFIVASWHLFSAALVVANRGAEGTRLEGPLQRIHAVAMEMNAVVASAAVFPLTLFESYHNPQGKLDGRPILMVNGYLSFGSNWHWLKERLIRAGLGPIYTTNVGTGRSIRTYATQLQAIVRRIQKETGKTDLVLIGHSKGGLVSVDYATHLAQETNTKVTDVITIGSPLAGTPVAYIGPGYDAAEMRPCSAFHQRLRVQMAAHPDIRFFHIASTSDAVVPLASALFGEDPLRHLVLNDLGHLSLVFSSRVTDRICHWLKPTLQPRA